MSVIEISAFIMSALGVGLTARRKMLCWPVGLASVFLYAWVFWQAKLYSDTLLQFLFALLQIYGWRRWAADKSEGDGAAIRKISPRVCAFGLLAGALGGAALGGVMARTTDAAIPWLDSALTSFSLVAQTWMARKYLACWQLWISIDAIYVLVYEFKRLHLTAALYLMFIILALIGLRSWKQVLACQTKQKSSEINV